MHLRDLWGQKVKAVLDSGIYKYIWKLTNCMHVCSSSIWKFIAYKNFLYDKFHSPVHLRSCNINFRISYWLQNIFIPKVSK